MIEVPITEKMIKNAKRNANELGKLNNSITSGEGNIAGFIGEIAASQVIGGDICNTYEYDILYFDGYDVISYDVKTKRCTSKPKPHYECSVSNFHNPQKCDKYVFVRVECVKDVYNKVWVLGEYPKEQYFKDAKFLKEGQVDQSNGFVVKADCYNLPISSLKEISYGS